ncbi:FecR family protein [Chitinophaga polysaccharea]|uniref:FecR family protein n=1 Tax=Chitinophaga polysaccharea TaxID=1293035 RepID=UPI00115C3AD5|nr:FecR family protein [Chitinophaga polysaccharea]
MEQISLLLQKIRNGIATAADIALLEEMLLREEDAALKQQLLEAYQRTVADKEQVLAPEKTAEILSRLHARMEADAAPPLKAPRRITVWRQVAAAASVLIIAGIAGMKYLNNGSRTTAVAAAVQQTVNRISNKGEVIKILAMADGSVVKLSPNSTLSWVNKERCVNLQGQAAFIVQADKNKPFTVHAGGIATTALGTTFTVSTLTPGRISVKLSEGKVLIHTPDNGKDIYLSPGEAFTVNTGTRLFTVVKETGKQETLSRDAASDVVLSFKNEPLENVLHSLEKHFKKPVYYNKEDISKLYFTGSILKKDSLKNILSAIGAMNQLVVTVNNDSTIISSRK